MTRTVALLLSALLEQGLSGSPFRLSRFSWLLLPVAPQMFSSGASSPTKIIKHIVCGVLPCQAPVSLFLNTLVCIANGCIATVLLHSCMGLMRMIHISASKFAAFFSRAPKMRVGRPKLGALQSKSQVLVMANTASRLVARLRERTLVTLAMAIWCVPTVTAQETMYVKLATDGERAGTLRRPGTRPRLARICAT